MSKVVSYEEIYMKIIENIPDIAKGDWIPTTILGIQSGGGIPANILKMRFMAVTEMYIQTIHMKISKYHSTGQLVYPKPRIEWLYLDDDGRMVDPRIKQHDRILIVDDVLDDGDTMAKAVSYAETLTKDIKIYSLYAKKKWKNKFKTYDLIIGNYKKKDKDWIEFYWEKEDDNA